MQAGRVSPQTRWTNPRREPANRRNSARMGEAALCGLLAGPNGAAEPAKRKGEEAVRRIVTEFGVDASSHNLGTPFRFEGRGQRGSVSHSMLDRVPV